MEFGKVSLQQLPSVDFSLPSDTKFTQETLRKNPAHTKLKVYVGCAKWGIKDWVGQIFQPKTKENQYLEAYVNQFNAIELNATFYKLYGAETIEKWKVKAASNTDFLFCPKFPSIITHVKRLKDATELTTEYYKAIIAFEDKLGPAFLQLNDNFGPKNFSDLQQYLEHLPQDVPLFVELRHEAWFSDRAMQEKVFELFRKLNIGAVITDTSGRRDVVHMNLSTSSAFIRFVGNNLHLTDYQRIDEWIVRIKKWQNLGLENLYFFMHQQEETASPVLADYFISGINKALDLDIKRPKFIKKAPELF